MGKFKEYVKTEILRRERYAKKLSGATMSYLINKKSQCSYLNIENGIVEPKITDINMICNVLGGTAKDYFNIK
jgi:transcriptional regulator with XRE-family HTH domain